MRCSLEVGGNGHPQEIIDSSTTDEHNLATFNICQNSKYPHSVSRVSITRSVAGLSHI